MSLLRILGFGVGSDAVGAFQLQQTVRWRNKPRWLPRAKSKMFRVAPRPVIEPEEYEELKKLHVVYKTQVRSIRRFFYYEKVKTDNLKSHVGSEENILEEERQWAEAIHANDLWNKEIALERDAYLKEKSEKKMKNIERHKEMQERRKENIYKAAQKKIETITEISKTCITRENLDEAILQCLNNPINYNYTIELDGTKVMETNIIGADKVTQMNDI